ncbi:hypothetical protein CkaCkLH20_03348 [Colletotrichum karsti]|uniref:Uncharacterized protein n=1 Tax=Colletotrichum karsti TaxID=1095194 RepID=A0A9P6IHJ5_9PEZI|nr:uncharacterized protein CkaCkLH20_03348 [Colletotrichum karsti]KAF9879115.1 hypothetical protein CkaCkLH20_03348 [Colletotrichum karsti]
MDQHSDGQGSLAAQKFIFTRPEERKIRRRFIYTAFFFDAIAIALIIPLCVGGWVHNANQVGGAVNSEDTHLVTWSAVYRRSESQRESTFVLTWFLSSCCFEEAYIDSGSALAGCVHRTPGSSFDLESIVKDVEGRLAYPENLGDTASEGRLVGPNALEFTGAETISSTRDALASYGIYLAINIGTWMMQIISKRHKIVLSASHWRVMAAAQVLALFALLVASGITTSAAHKARNALGEFKEIFPYHAIGSSFAAMTWCAFVSHMFGCLAYGATVFLWNRLQRSELYPPEPEDEIERIRRRSTRGAGQYRSRRFEEPAVHREVDPNAPVDDELPPYSRVDPNEGGISPLEQARHPDSVQAPIELAHLRGVRNPLPQPIGEQGNIPAPAYELHQWPLR